MGEQKFELPSVGHEGMDAEHKDLEELMQKACSSLKAEDVQVLSKMFAEHAKEEEELMERSSFGDSGVKSLFQEQNFSVFAEELWSTPLPSTPGTQGSSLK